MYGSPITLFVLLIVVVFTYASPVIENQNRDSRMMDNEIKRKAISSEPSPNEDSLIVKLTAKCSQREVTSCVMLKLANYMNRLLKKSQIDLSESIVIRQTSPVVEDSNSRSISVGGSEQVQLGQLIADKMLAFVKSRTLKWKILPETDVVVSAQPDGDGTLILGLSVRTRDALESGRGKMKNMGPLLAAGIAKIGMLGILAFKALVLLVGKAILVSKLAFLLAAGIGLKKLFSQQRHVTYEVVAHPHHSHSTEHHGGGDSYSSGWGRSLNVSPVSSGDLQELMYRAHV